MSTLYSLFRPLLFTFDAEKAHRMTLKALQSGMLPSCPPFHDRMLEVDLWGLKFPNPVGLAAGFDKNAEVIGPMLGLGFGFSEVGTVTPEPQEGNPTPRVFRDPGTESLINAMGFPNVGMGAFRHNLEKFLEKKPRPPGIVGVNIGKNKDQSEPAKDYTLLIRNLAPLADYITINISSPNTPGLRDLQKREPLLELINAVQDERTRTCGKLPPPILVKLAPDLDEAQREELAQTVMDGGVDGLVLTNTTLDRPDYLPRTYRGQKGGLSGKPLRDKSTESIRHFYRLTGGKLPIIGSGGIASARDAYEKIRAGASLVQLYTGLVFEGPAVALSINKGLLELLEADGLEHISQAVGADHK